MINEEKEKLSGINRNSINWFPGHMAKTKRILSESIRLVDVVIEILDARIPQSSKNPDIDGLIKNKPKVIVLNKSDLADMTVSKKWRSYFREKGQKVIFVDALKGTGIRELNKVIDDMMKEKVARDRAKGIIAKPVRSMVVGVPNVGKSAFINKIAGKKVAKTGDRPGVTRAKQWIRLNEKIELLDTPGILWPKFEDKEVGLKLAFTGAIKDEVYDTVDVAAILLERLLVTYPDLLKARYKLDDVENSKGYELLEIIAKKRGAIMSGGVVDYTRIASIILDELRGGKIGKISLEAPKFDMMGD
ncbi:MAG: ribosome biogenesis GTPase YlqF [Clostridiales bacterium]|nr:ribosome biogenesis GTPase YlqF [Clostridiales bacterium]